MKQNSSKFQKYWSLKNCWVQESKGGKYRAVETFCHQDTILAFIRSLEYIILVVFDFVLVKEDIDQDNNAKKAHRTYLKGRTLNVVPDHSPEAEQLLSKAVKLEPNLVDAWIELGECYWKRGDVETAKTCFEGALSHVSSDSFAKEYAYTVMDFCLRTVTK